MLDGYTSPGLVTPSYVVNLLTNLLLINEP